MSITVFFLVVLPLLLSHKPLPRKVVTEHALHLLIVIYHSLCTTPLVNFIIVRECISIYI
jgi:hypothetical protein